jgi:hypothetical protein
MKDERLRRSKLFGALGRGFVRECFEVQRQEKFHRLKANPNPAQNTVFPVAGSR